MPLKLFLVQVKDKWLSGSKKKQWQKPLPSSLFSLFLRPGLNLFVHGPLNWPKPNACATNLAANCEHTCLPAPVANPSSGFYLSWRSASDCYAHQGQMGPWVLCKQLFTRSLAFGHCPVAEWDYREHPTYLGAGNGLWLIFVRAMGAPWG